MNNILRDEVNQHTSDEVEKVLAALEDQGVDITALQTALDGQGVDITAIKDALAGTGTGSSGMKIKSFQKGEVSPYLKTSEANYIDVSISSVTAAKCLPIVGGRVKNDYSKTVADDYYYAKVTSSTKLRIYLNDVRYSSSLSGYVIPWYLIEFE